MKKSLIGIAAILCLTTMIGCKQQQSESGSSIPTSSSNSQEPGSSSNNPSVIRVQGVSVTPGKSSVYLDSGNTIQLRATISPSNVTDRSVTWTSSDTALATVDGDGLVTCLAQGTVRITATSNDDNSKKDIATVTIKQYESQEDTIDALNLPNFYETYKRNTQTLDNVSDINTKELTRTNFFKNAENKKDNYRVGTDNPFQLKVTGKITDKFGTDELIPDPFVNVSIMKFNTTSNKYEVIPQEELANTATIAQDKKSVQFKDAAIGNLYKIIVSADVEHYKATGAGYSQIEFEVEPCKGFNAYDKYDLTVFDNSQDSWNAIKEQHGLANVTANGLVLHGDITVTSNDIPAEFKYSEAEVDNYISVYRDTDFRPWCIAKEVSEEVGRSLLINSTKDRTEIFRHVTPASAKDFTFEGNYFKIDCSGIKQIYAFEKSIEKGKVYLEYKPEVEDPSKGCDGSHSQLFGINNKGVNYYDFGANGTFAFKNMTVIGNGDLSEDDKYLGGLITFKFNSVNFVASNVLTSKSFTTFLGEAFFKPGDEEYKDMVFDARTTMTIDRCKCYDSYNSMLYIWGVDQNVVTNSIMKRAGGAIALLDEVDADDRESTRHSTPKVDCYNVELDNPVKGDEPWFRAHQATALVTMMEYFGRADLGRWLGRNAYLHGEHKNILTVDNENKQYINLIAIDIDGGAPLSNSLDKGSMLQGHFNIYNDAAFTELVSGLDMAQLAAADPTADQTTFVTQVLTAYATGNVLPTYRMMAKNNNAAGIIAATKTGHAMLFDQQYGNGIIADYNNPVSMSGANPALPTYPLGGDYTLTPIPMYEDASGTGAEVAGANYMSGRLTSVLDGLASGDFLSLYLQPGSADVEYLGAFIKMQKLDMGA